MNFLMQVSVVRTLKSLRSSAVNNVTLYGISHNCSHTYNTIQPLKITHVTIRIRRIEELAVRYAGRILPLQYGDDQDVIEAIIPAKESESFVEDARGATMGSALVAFAFHGYELSRGDFSDVRSKGIYGRFNMRAEQLVKAVHQRKGMVFFDELVISAEKQRTRKK
ncbi:hypothetical protein RI129_011736 [Pyrocoelia pectoralis]|uniref:Uncharacterized protein n=1 Tax=Pyrocoelia pectoralis TaxID=417401 RepID=A0AAN7V9D4_9COLE